MGHPITVLEFSSAGSRFVARGRPSRGATDRGLLAQTWFRKDGRAGIRPVERLRDVGSAGGHDGPRDELPDFVMVWLASQLTLSNGA